VLGAGFQLAPRAQSEALRRSGKLRAQLQKGRIDEILAPVTKLAFGLGLAGVFGWWRIKPSR